VVCHRISVPSSAIVRSSKNQNGLAKLQEILGDMPDVLP